MVNIAFNLQIVVCHSVSPLVLWVPIIKSVSQSVSWWVGLSICRSAIQPAMHQSVNQNFESIWQPISQSDGESVCLSFCHSVSQSVSEWVSESGRLTDKCWLTVCLPVFQSIGVSTSLRVSPYVFLPFRVSLSLSRCRSVGRQSARLPVCKSVSLSVYLSLTKSVNQSGWHTGRTGVQSNGSF